MLDPKFPGKKAGNQYHKLAKENKIVGGVFKGVQGIMKDQNQQKMVKGLLKGLSDINKEMNKEDNPLNLIGKLFQN